MTLHDKRHSTRAMVLACGVLSAGLSISCTGDIMDGARGEGGPGTGGETGGPGPVGAPGTGVPPGASPPILEPGPGEASCDSREFTPARVWRLSDDQYIAAVRDLVPGSQPPTILTPGRSAQQFIDFAELFEIGPATASDIRASATAVATEAVKNLDALLGCKAGQSADACNDAFIEGFASRAFRRPLTDVEKTGLKTVFAAGNGVSRAEGIRLVMSAVLQAPSFLYRTELGKANSLQPGQTVELTTHELASALSFLMLNSIPDADLRAAADDGSLTKPEVFKSQVERLLKLPRVQDHLTSVYLKWVGLGLGLNADLANTEKEFTPELKKSMEEEARLFFKHLIGNGGTMDDILTTNKGFADATLARHMGMPAPAGTGMQAVTYPAAERAGALTLPGILARYSVGHPEVFRGKYVRDEFLCQEIPPPPNDPEIEELTEMTKNLSVRQQSEARLANKTCGGCHALMDPIGLSFSNYDALGRFTTKDKAGATIDSSGSVSAAEDADGPVKNAVELGQKLAKSNTVRSCIEGKMLGFALGRMTEKYDACELKKIDGFVTAGGGKLSALMAGIVYSSAFRFRTGGN